MRLRDLYSFKFGDWIDIVREIGEDLVDALFEEPL